MMLAARGRSKEDGEAALDVYEGTFEHDAIHGRGIVRYADGAVYEGNFAHGVKEGFGKESAYENGELKVRYAGLFDSG